MNKETVSIIIGIRNRYDQRIINALKSIRNQTYRQDLIEIILVDYGSEEAHYTRFRELCRQFDIQGIWTRVKTIWNRSHCLNIGIQASRSKYVLLSDIDIIFQENYIEQCVKEIGSNPHQAVYCKMLDIPQGLVLTDVLSEYQSIKAQATDRQGKGVPSYPYGSSILFVQADFIKKVRGYDEFYKVWGKEDSDLNRTLEKTGIGLKEISSQTSHIHQWHEKYENIDNLPEFEENKRQNILYYKKNVAVSDRNPHGWGMIQLDGSRLGSMPEYPQKLPGALWGITTFYNPAGYSNKYENYSRFRAAGKQQGLKLLAVELAFGNVPFELKNEDADILIQLRCGRENILWQKEALLNVALHHLPEDCDKIAWLDCDILFKNHHWVRETSILLEKYKVVQPYSQVVHLARDQFDVLSADGIPDGVEAGEKWHGMAYGIVQNGGQFLSQYAYHGHVGYAWAARKEIFDRLGFYDRFILGSGDIIMAYAFFGNDNESSQKLLVSDFLKNDRDAWAKAMHQEVNSSVFFVPGGILHLWHGEYQNRDYSLRHFILKKYNFNPYLDIQKEPSGIWRWVSKKPALHKAVRDYFFRRKENVAVPIHKKRMKIIPREVTPKNKTLLFKIDRLYLEVIAFCGKIFQDVFPDFYIHLKKLFPDRAPGQNVKGFHLASVGMMLKAIALIMLLYLLVLQVML